jgi:hypothetical protein
MASIITLAGSSSQIYLSELMVAYNNRKVTDAERAREALRGFDGKRLTYKTTDSQT